MSELRFVRLFVRDLAKMAAFYGETLGFPLFAADERTARFRAGATELVLQSDPPFGDEAFRDFNNQLKGNMRGMGSSLHFEIENVPARFAELRAKGLVPTDPERNAVLQAPIARPDGWTEFAIEDPEGYWLFFGSRPEGKLRPL